MELAAECAIRLNLHIRRPAADATAEAPVYFVKLREEIPAGIFRTGRSTHDKDNGKQDSQQPSDHSFSVITINHLSITSSGSGYLFNDSGRVFFPGSRLPGR
jgi:hypothetical protein